MDLAALGRYLPQVEGTLGRSYDALGAEEPAPVRPYVALNREFTLRGGKRFRALLLLAGYHIASGRPPRPVVRAASALEHFQSWMLIHDDIIDHADQRRGGRTVHLEVGDLHRRGHLVGDPDDYGVGVAITLGDLEEPLTLRALLDVPVAPERRLRALDELIRMTRLTAYGQLLDLRNGTLPPARVTEKDVLEVHRLKSAVYTVVAPLRIGSVLAGGAAELLRDLEAIGTDLGIAFQLRDDVLGAGFGSGAIGKSANDLPEGKRTLLVVRAWRDGSARDRRAIARVLGDRRASAASVERARDAIRSSGSLAHSERTIAALTRRGLARLQGSRRIPTTAKPLLREISDRLTVRAV